MKKLWRKLEGSWTEMLDKIYDEKAKSDLEALVNDEDYCQTLEKEELDWQPYPLGPDGKDIHHGE